MFFLAQFWKLLRLWPHTITKIETHFHYLTHIKLAALYFIQIYKCPKKKHNFFLLSRVHITAAGGGRRLLDFLDLQTWRQRLFQLLGLLFVGHNQCVQEAGTTDLEFGVVGILLYLDGTSILPAGFDQEILDFFNFLRHLCAAQKQRTNND